MRAMFRTIVDWFREDFGYPVSLIRLLEEHPDIRVPLDVLKPSIDAQGIVPWHELGKPHYLSWPRSERGTLLGWKMRDGYGYGSFTLHRPEYAQIGQCEIIDDWVCDISDVHGFSASKSKLRDFASMDEMVETNSRAMIDEITQEKLAKNLAHSEIRIVHSPGSDHFCRHLWDGRLFLMNSGGSHHFAAAKYIAARLPQSVALRGKLRTYSLNPLAIASLRRDYEMFVISDDTPISLGFHDAMEAFRATWLWHHMPRPFESAKAILLPKSERRSRKVADLLRNAGVVDLGQHLADLAAHSPPRMKAMRLPHLDVKIELDFESGSFVAPQPWQRARGRIADQSEAICRVGFGVSPLLDRIYVDGLEVDARYRRKGYASALLKALVDKVSPPAKPLRITPLHEVWAAHEFWSSLRAGAVPGLVVTTDVRVSEMDEEAQRWRAQPVAKGGSKKIDEEQRDVHHPEGMERLD